MPAPTAAHAGAVRCVGRGICIPPQTPSTLRRRRVVGF